MKIWLIMASLNLTKNELLKKWNILYHFIIFIIIWKSINYLFQKKYILKIYYNIGYIKCSKFNTNYVH